MVWLRFVRCRLVVGVVCLLVWVLEAGFAPGVETG